MFLVDIFFVVLHFYSLTLPLTESTGYLRLDKDGGYAEVFQYAQYVLIAGFLTVLFFKQKKGVYLIWALLFLYFYVDDAFSIHESYGKAVVIYFSIQNFMGLRGQDFGELAVSAVTGLFFLLPIANYAVRGSSESRHFSIQFLLLLGVFVFFGVGVDMLHSLLNFLPGSGILTVIEDSGEMFSMSAMVWYALTYTLSLFGVKKPEASIVQHQGESLIIEKRLIPKSEGQRA
ncbi:hypothetical protein [Pontibacter pamirensis]|uniref:hypothetical protein n=1 Tax=Pontibacter pamirensis TaxID=2562824 RepID=UPI00138986D3|nr:hypothetical protein [Pontibacter pamirensis]